jgi:xanthine dehydrogenase accessory factor
MAEDVLDEAARVGREGVAAALATVVRTAGSTPRHPGASMLVTRDRLIGTIGGGRIEVDTVEAARAVLAGQGAARLVRNLGRDLGMCCGGTMDLWIEPLAPIWGTLAEAGRRRASRQACALVSDLGQGTKALVTEHPCILPNRPELDGARFYEPITPTPRLFLFGAGHVAHAVAPLCRSIGFEVLVCDEDESFASPERFPGMTLLPTLDAAEVARDHGPLGAFDYALVVTRDHALDQAIVEKLAPERGLRWLGVIGSRAKAERFRRRLAQKGLEVGFQSPVGLDIGAETPAEIAVAIAGELIQKRRVPS